MTKYEQQIRRTISLAQSVTRRSALKKFGLGVAGMALACLGLANKAEARPNTIPNRCDRSTDPCCSNNCKSWLPKKRAGLGVLYLRRLQP
jgi:hypothetical protein